MWSLFHFTGNSCHIIPSRIGLWMYELVAQLGNCLQILIHMHTLAVETVQGERTPVHDMEGRHSSYWCLTLTTFLLTV